MGETAGLIGGEGVHRVEDEGFEAGDAGGAGAQHVVEDGMEEGFGLAGSGAGGDDRGLGTVAVLGGQAAVGVLLVPVGDQARVPVEGLVGYAGASARGQVGQAQADEGPDEDALLGVFEEVREGAPRLRIRQCEGRRQVVDDRGADALGLEGREQEGHD